MSNAPRPVPTRGRRRVFVALSVGLVLAIVFAGIALFALDEPLRGIVGNEHEATVVEAGAEEIVSLDDTGLDTFHNEHATLQVPTGWEAEERPQEDEFGDPVEGDGYTLDFVGAGDTGYEVTLVRTEAFGGDPITALDVLTSVEEGRAEENDTYEQVTLEEVPAESAGGIDAAYAQSVFSLDDLSQLIEGAPPGERMRQQLAISDGERIYSLIITGPRDLIEDSDAVATMIDSLELQA